MPLLEGIQGIHNTVPYIVTVMLFRLVGFVFTALEMEINYARLYKAGLNSVSLYLIHLCE